MPDEGPMPTPAQLALVIAGLYVAFMVVLTIVDYVTRKYAEHRSS